MRYRLPSVPLLSCTPACATSEIAARQQQRHWGASRRRTADAAELARRTGLEAASPLSPGYAARLFSSASRRQESPSPISLCFFAFVNAYIGDRRVQVVQTSNQLSRHHFDWERERERERNEKATLTEREKEKANCVEKYHRRQLVRNCRQSLWFAWLATNFFADLLHLRPAFGSHVLVTSACLIYTMTKAWLSWPDTNCEAGHLTSRKDSHNFFTIVYRSVITCITTYWTGLVSLFEWSSEQQRRQQQQQQQQQQRRRCTAATRFHHERLKTLIYLHWRSGGWVLLAGKQLQFPQRSVQVGKSALGVLCVLAT